MTGILAQPDSNTADGDIASARQVPLIREILPTLVRAIHDNHLVPVAMLQLRLLAVQAHRVRAEIFPIVAELGALSVFLAVFSVSEGHGVALLTWALEFGREATGCEERDVLFETVAVVVVFADGAVHVTPGTIAP